MHTPARVFMAFDNVPNLEALGRKLHEFSAALQATGKGLGDDEAGVCPGVNVTLLGSRESERGAI